MSQIAKPNREWRRHAARRGLGVAAASSSAFLGTLAWSNPASAQGFGGDATLTPPAGTPIVSPNIPTTTIPPNTPPTPQATPGQVPFPPNANRDPFVPPNGMGPSSSTQQVTPAAQEQNDNLYVFWAFNGNNFTTLRENIFPKEIVPSTYWASAWTWSNNVHGGYEGFQSDAYGNPWQAVFSGWDGTTAVAGTGASCQTFSENGTGYQCFLPFTFSTNDFYQYQLTKLSGGDGHGGYVWNGSIYDFNTGITSKIGAIDVPGNDGATNAPDNFSEYFGSPFACGTSPVSWIQWTPPAATGSGNQYGSNYSGYHYGGDPCSNYGVVTGNYNGQPYVSGKLGGSA